MTYSFGSPAMNTGRYRSQIVAACRRATLTDACSDVGLMWNTADKASSVDNRSVITRRNRSAFRRPHTAMKACIDARHRTSSALGSGNSGLSINALSGNAPTPPIGVLIPLAGMERAKAKPWQYSGMVTGYGQATHPGVALGTRARVRQPTAGRNPWHVSSFRHNRFQSQRAGGER